MEIKRWGAIATALGLSAGLVGCVVEAGEGVGADELATTEQEVYFWEDGVWGQKIINVCFITAGYATEKAWIKDILKGQRSWEEAGNVNFVGFGSCLGVSTGVGITLTTADAASTATLGQVGNAVNMTLPVGSSPQTAFVACIDHGLNREQCIKSVTLHEFGHALALAHEQKREEADDLGCTAIGQGSSGDMTWGSFDFESIMAYAGGTCDPGYYLSQLDRRGAARIYGERTGAVAQLSDYNGDGRDDLLCQNPVSGQKWIDHSTGTGAFAGTDWSMAANWCGQDWGKLYKGDFNNDGKADLLCHDIANGTRHVDLADASGNFAGTDWSSGSNWCGHDAGQLLVGNFNGSGGDDILCHDRDSGYVWIDYVSSGQFNGTNWESALNWCSGVLNRLFVGDFNGDGYDDLVCHNASTGTRQVDINDPSTRFGVLNYTHSNNWCSYADGEIIIGDFNNDDHDDALCHSADGSQGKRIDYASGVGQLSGTDWVNAGLDWCSLNDQRLYVGDVNNDGRDDLVCHSLLTGDKWIDRADANGEFAGTDWSGSPNWCRLDAQTLR